MKDLPPFKKRNRDDVESFIAEILTNEQSIESHLDSLLEYEDGHFRALFRPGYFVLQPGQTEPTKSQWNSLKKKLKRHELSAFAFKEHGEVGTKEKLYYLDFGFLPGSPSINKAARKRKNL